MPVMLSYVLAVHTFQQNLQKFNTGDSSSPSIFIWLHKRWIYLVVFLMIDCQKYLPLFFQFRLYLYFNLWSFLSSVFENVSTVSISILKDSLYLSIFSMRAHEIWKTFNHSFKLLASLIFIRWRNVVGPFFCFQPCSIKTTFWTKL